MDTHPNDDSKTADAAIDQRRPVDPPLRIYDPKKAYFPREAKTSAGTTVFRTFDSEVYCRLADGSIRRSAPKVNGKEARKARAIQRKQGK